MNNSMSVRCDRMCPLCSLMTVSPDVDECQNNLHRCGDGQLCNNLPGSYRCDCQPGYQYDSYRRTCVGTYSQSRALKTAALTAGGTAVV